MKFSLILIILICISRKSYSLDNGLALTPPMGWLTWERYRCIIDCETRPDECISERLILKTADLMVSEGFLDAGYNYIGIDDCWAELSRDKNQKLVPDKKRFPNGMKFIADYVHKKGLKLGIYGDFGTKTCAGYPGTLNHMEIDAKTFGEWEVDYVKLDGCAVDIQLMDEGYPKFGRFLNKTGRPMLYSCSWPAYQQESGTEPNYKSIAEHCNMWRNYDDIEDSWKSVEDIMDHFGNNSRKFAIHAGPGHWNDADMLIIGNFGLSEAQERAQMAVWVILGSPLLMSTNLESLSPNSKALLLKKDLIDINNDPLGKAGVRVFKDRNFGVWRREVTPNVGSFPSLVFAFVSHNVNGAPKLGNFTFEQLEIDGRFHYTSNDLLPNEFQKWNVVQYGNTGHIEVMVVPTGVAMIKMTFDVARNVLKV